MWKARFCDDCALPSTHHWQSWMEGLAEVLLPYFFFGKLGKKMELAGGFLLEKIFLLLRLAEWKSNFAFKDLQLRTVCFIKAAQKRGFKFQALYSGKRSIGEFVGKFNDKKFRFYLLPDAYFKNKYSSKIIDDKKTSKKRLLEGGFPVPESKFFWFFQRRAAFQYGKKLGWPLVVKPRAGSVARHCYTDIRYNEQLKAALEKVIKYSPCFLVERYLAGCSVFRATVVDFANVFCCVQIPANVIGDGSLTIRQLIDQKNNLSNRGLLRQNEFTLYKIKEDQTTQALLQAKGYNMETVPKTGEKVFLQKNPFLRLGGDIIEKTEAIHQENKKLFQQLAMFFDQRLIGIDFMAQDISLPYQEQKCAVLELNANPCIEMHQMPSEGKPQNVADKVVDLVFKYYLS